MTLQLIGLIVTAFILVASSTAETVIDHTPLNVKIRHLGALRQGLNDIQASSKDGGDYPAAFKVERIEDLHYTCTSELYCKGRLLQSVQALDLYPDSKTFVDKSLKKSSDEVLQLFQDTFPNDEDISKKGLEEFMEENFESTSVELVDCELGDWNHEPEAFKNIGNLDFNRWAMELNLIWKKLCRQVTPTLVDQSDRHSLIYLPHPFVVPGGRFREMYYWDSYWTIKGLLVSGMYKTVEDMLMNFAALIRKVGFIPNGSRMYYLTRSQPPLLTGMFYEHYLATGNRSFIQKHLEVLEKELKFWEDRRTIDVTLPSGETHSVFQYRAESDAPRPESFREDVNLVSQLTSEDDKKFVWKNLASAAESGWDFSSRWLRDKTNLRTIEITNILPVDLNAYICWNLKIMKFFFEKVEVNQTKAEEYTNRLDAHRKTFQAVFFVDNDQETGWFDFNIRSQKHNFDFYPSSAVPMFTQCIEDLSEELEEKIFMNMKSKGAFNRSGGVPTSIHENTKQQWDFPNGWAPLNHMVIKAFVNAKSEKVQAEGISLAKKWLHNNYHTYQTSGVMWEKYDVDQKEGAGNGGEYDVQAGFGWSNGVVLDLLTSLDTLVDEAKEHKKDDIKAEAIIAHESLKETYSSSPKWSSTSPVVVGLLYVLAKLMC